MDFHAATLFAKSRLSHQRRCEPRMDLEFECAIPTDLDVFFVVFVLVGLGPCFRSLR